jgi:biotin transporter BioY
MDDLQETEPDIKKQGFRIGVLNGVLALAILYVSYWMGLQTFVNVKTIERFVPYMIIILVITGIQLRKRNGGHLSFRQGLQYAFLSYVVTAVIIAIGTYILYNVVDKDLGEQSFRLGLQKSKEMMQGLGLPDTEINKNLDRAEKAGSETGFKQIFLGMGLGLIWDFMKSLLVAVIIRKEKPVF